MKGLSEPGVRFSKHLKFKIFRKFHTVCMELTKILGLRSLVKLAPEFYGDLVYKLRKIIGENGFPYHFKKIICSL